MVQVREFNPSGTVKVLMVDVGAKNNQIRCLINRGASVKLVPWDYDFTKEEYDGLFLSNGTMTPVARLHLCRHHSAASRGLHHAARWFVLIGVLSALLCPNWGFRPRRPGHGRQDH